MTRSSTRLFLTPSRVRQPLHSLLNSKAARTLCFALSPSKFIQQYKIGRLTSRRKVSLSSNESLDFILKTSDGAEFKVHRAVAVRSPHFAKLIAKAANVIIAPDVQYYIADRAQASPIIIERAACAAVSKTIVVYLYTGFLEGPAHEDHNLQSTYPLFIYSLLEIANNLLQLTELVDLVVKYIATLAFFEQVMLPQYYTDYSDGSYYGQKKSTNELSQLLVYLYKGVICSPVLSQRVKGNLEDPRQGDLRGDDSRAVRGV
jgi:hypothetical protein